MMSNDGTAQRERQTEWKSLWNSLINEINVALAVTAGSASSNRKWFIVPCSDSDKTRILISDYSELDTILFGFQSSRFYLSVY